MRSFTRIAATTVLAGGLTVFGVGAAFADPPDEVTEPSEEVTDTTDEVAEPGQELSPEAAALLEDPQVQELLADEDAVELLSDPEALEMFGALLEAKGPAEALEELDLPAFGDDAPENEAPEAEEVTGDAPNENVTQPVENVTEDTETS